jgi:hypothetical protein
MNEQIHNPAEKQSHFLRTALTVAIVIVMNLFFNYAVSFVYNEPAYDQFVKPAQVVDTITTQADCVAVGGQWNGPAIPQQGYCDQNYTNEQNYQSAMTVYNRNVFITLVVLGIISIIIGSFVSVSVLPAALSWGGVLSLVIASMRYWGNADKLFKVIILACALGVLIWLAVKKFEK